MPDLTAQQMADAVGAIQTRIFEILEEEFPDSRGWDRWVQDENREEWARLLENDDKIIDAFTVEFAGLGHPAITEIPGGTVEPRPTFVIDFFEQYDLGDATNHSSKRIRDKVMRAMFALSVKTDLGIRDYCKGHQQLQAPPQAEVTQFGDRFAHWIPCSLTVLMANFYTRG